MSIIFRPWIGEQYFSQKPKILILGESHYLKENEQNLEDFTIRVVRELRLREGGKNRFFTIIAKIVSGNPYAPLSDESSREFWNKVAFYNFIQFPVGHNARMRPAENMWEDSLSPFKMVLDELNPDIILVLGKELAHYVKTLDTNFGSVFCYWYHPSSPKYFKKADAINAFEKSTELYLSSSGQ